MLAEEKEKPAFKAVQRDTSMPEIVFIEGVSGVGKSTMVRALANALCAKGCKVKSYVEFDFTNPIDFYCTAYLRQEEYAALCARYATEAKQLERYSVPAGKAVLVRYYDEDTPLFGGALLKELARAEFCYHPAQLVPLPEYRRAYEAVWQDFAKSLDPGVQFYLFDGSLMHHPLNDMMRNNRAQADEMGAHVKALLGALQPLHWRVYYLYVDDLSAQLASAHKNRGQEPPTREELAFWQKRRENDQLVLDAQIKDYEAYDVFQIGWDEVTQRILSSLKTGT